MTVSVRCPAKLNLFLTVLAREENGYHQLETAFQAIELADVVGVRPQEVGIELSVVGSDGTPDSLRGNYGPVVENTCYRAAQVFFKASDISGGAALRLEKHIPAGTGLGGASSDAAGVLLALNHVYGEPFLLRDLIALGGTIGADVPFFLARHPLALGWGRGDRLLALPPLPVAEVVLMIPSARVSTAEAYGTLQDVVTLPAPSAAMEQRALASWEEMAWLQRNDFEVPIFAAHKEFEGYLSSLGSAGAVVSRMTGSGSGLFGIFTDAALADAAADRLSDVQGVDMVLRTKTLAAHPLNPIASLR